jgi:hypothetical protein
MAAISTALGRHCPDHDRDMVPGGIGYVRCPVVQCRQFRRVECGQFLKRIRPQGVTVVCRRPVEVETWAVGPDGERVYHGGRCRQHPDTARYGPRAGWSVQYIPLPTEP